MFDRYYGHPEGLPLAEEVYLREMHSGDPMTADEEAIALAVGGAIDRLRARFGLAGRELGPGSLRMVDDAAFFSSRACFAISIGPYAYMPRLGRELFASTLAHEFAHIGSFLSWQSIETAPVRQEDGTTVLSLRFRKRRSGVTVFGRQRPRFLMLNEALTECVAAIVCRTIAGTIGEPGLGRGGPRFTCYRTHFKLLEQLLGIEGPGDPAYMQKTDPALRDYFTGSVDWLRELAVRSRIGLQRWCDLNDESAASTAQAFGITL